MRFLVFLLLVGNLAFLAWSRGYLGGVDHPDAARLTQQIEPDRLRIVARDDPPPPPAVRREVRPAERCAAWSGLATGDAERVDELLAARFADLTASRQIVPGASSWWVFIPPLASKADADRKAGELKRLAVPEFFIVQEEGPNRFAISLGLFSTEEAARNRLEELRGKGVRSARHGVKTSRPDTVTLELRGPGPVLDGAREAIAAFLPEARTATCAGR